MNTFRRHNLNVYPVSNPPKPGPFSSNDDMIEKSLMYFQTKININCSRKSLKYGEISNGKKLLETTLRESIVWNNYWHKSFNRSFDSSSICRKCIDLKLNKKEREIVILLVVNQLGLLDTSLRYASDIIEVIDNPVKKSINTVRYLSEYGRLFKKQLITIEDEEENVGDRKFIVDPQLLDEVLAGEKKTGNHLRIKSEQNLYPYLKNLIKIIAQKCEEVNDSRMDKGIVFRCNRKIVTFTDKLDILLQSNKEWRLSVIFQDLNSRLGQLTFISLLGKGLGYLDEDHTLFKGRGLSAVMSYFYGREYISYDLLKPDSYLIKKEYIQPDEGFESVLTGSPDSLENVEYELTEKSLKLLNLHKYYKKKHSGKFQVRKPTVNLKNLAHSDKTKKAISLALNHSKNAKKIMDEWGLRKVIPYGNGLTLLFYGPPGTGKTATAEAIANELNRHIIVADYSKIQNCFVGQTEKNVVKIFKEAKNINAVLFWDEADAMFSDRDSSSHQWEVRDINVLLQELEKFDGVCILATNRKISLDKALERRIAIKVEFKRPDIAQRIKIWEKLIPSAMPLSKEIGFRELAEYDLSGGEIKNVILNAARIALKRSKNGPLNIKDFQEAVFMEIEGSSKTGNNNIGFSRT